METRSRMVAALVVVASGCAAHRTRADRAAIDAAGAAEVPIELGGSSRITSLGPGDPQAFDFAFQARAREAAKLERASLLFVSRGGWAWSLGDPMAKRGTLFDVPRDVPAGTDVTKSGFRFVWSAPVDRVLVVADAKGARGESIAIGNVAIGREGFAPVPDAPYLGDAFVGLQEPLAIADIGGRRELVVVGQLVDATGRAVAPRSARLVLRHGSAVVVERDVRVAAPRGDEPIAPFVEVLDVPAGIDSGTLAIDASIEGRSAPLHREAAVTVATPRTLAPPLRGRFVWGNGPGETKLHTHYRFPEQRWAYDILARRGGATFTGDPSKNESFFAFGQPIYAAADGTVVKVVDDVPDNPGHVEPRKGAKNAQIVLDHGGFFTLYVHVRQGSAKVKVGDRVRAGDAIAAIGNAGISTEPHLHFAAFHFDETGRVMADPLRIEGLATADGAPVEGVPRGGEEYESRD